MIGKIFVLFRIQYFQQCRSRISLVVRSDLIYFVKEEYRVFGSAFFDGVHDPAGYRPNIRSSVASDLGFIPDTSQRHPYEFTVDGTCHAFGDRSLADSRRTYQAEDRSFEPL